MINYSAVIFMNKRLSGSISLLLATIIWGSAFVSQSVAMEHLGPFSFQGIRCALAVIGLLPVIALFDRKNKDGKSYWRRWADKKLWLAGILCGIPLFLACNLQQLGLVDTDPGKSGFLTAMYIVIVPILSILRRKMPSIMVPISVILAVAGLYFLSCVGVTSISIGDLLLLACALMFAIQITFVDIFAPSVDALRLNALQALVCAVLSSGIAAFTEQPTWQGIWDCALPLAHTGFLSMGAGYALQIIGQKHVEPTLSSLIMSLESVFAVIFEMLLLQQFLTGWETIGCVLVFAAVILSQIEIKPKAKSV